MKTKKGFNLYRKAKKIILNGNMLLSKRPEMILPEKWPTYFSKANDIYVTDLDNNTYLDMMCIVGHNILGYGNNKIDQIVVGENLSNSWGGPGITLLIGEQQLLC